MLWDTGLSEQARRRRRRTWDRSVARLTKSVAQQLAELGLKPDDVDIVGISHMHSDHTGQAAEFPNARLLIGKGDFEQTKGKDDPFGAVAQAGSKVNATTADVDVFGDGSVVALHLPGHTPDHSRCW